MHIVHVYMHVGMYACPRVCRGLELMLGVFSVTLYCIYWSRPLTKPGPVVSQLTWEPFVSVFQVLGWQDVPEPTWLRADGGYPNSGPHISTVRTLFTNPFPPSFKGPITSPYYYTRGLASTIGALGYKLHSNHSRRHMLLPASKQNSSLHWWKIFTYGSLGGGWSPPLGLLCFFLCFSMRQKGISYQEPLWYLSQPAGGDFGNRVLYLSQNTMLVSCSVCWLWKKIKVI